MAINTQTEMQENRDEIAGDAAPARAEEQGKQWAARPDPFPIHSINWPDGYKISLVESDGKWNDDLMTQVSAPGPIPPSVEKHAEALP